jgi:cytidylate kinase
VAAALQRRDSLDSTRKASPLRPADDAWVIDTTDIGIDEVVQSIIDRVPAAG